MTEKRFLLPALAFSALAPLAADAAIEFSLSNSLPDNDTSLTFLDASGTAAAGGVVALGWFDADLAALSVAETRDAFRTSFSWNADSADPAGGISFGSVNDFAVAAAPDSWGDAAGKTLYAFFGAGTTVESSDAFALLRFESEGAPLVFADDAFELILGANAVLGAVDPAFPTWVCAVGEVVGEEGTTIRFYAVPEPSAFALLAGLGALALAGTRRRRKISR
ncbi:PEP-CTERM sorting domain-containing protein [Candidatus Spyradosoma sp. SGI.093]|uniref:PEP-CTERM sorting domain-containing protein n=1 Tax=Candidatus Spyradosoma sp. SGI.093 TaxID=3420583 RepID=UPI003D08E41F